MVHPDTSLTENPRTSDGKMTSVAEALKLPRTASRDHQTLPELKQIMCVILPSKLTHYNNVCYNDSTMQNVSYIEPSGVVGRDTLTNSVFSLPARLVVNGKICSSDAVVFVFQSKISIFTSSFAVFVRQGQIEHVLRAKTAYLDKTAKRLGQIMLYFLVSFAVFVRQGSNRALFYNYKGILYKIEQYNLYTAKTRSTGNGSVKRKKCITHSGDQAGIFRTISLAFSHSSSETQYHMPTMPTTVEDRK